MHSFYNPHFHFFPQEGWINDPNGLVYYQGEYHLFYQYLLPRHWGHAVSRDLVHWEILPIALAPDELGDIWSGSAVVDWHDSSGFFAGGSGLVAIFTHQNVQQHPPRGPQVQSIAYSRDRGRTWIKYAGNPVISNPGVADFRDPKVFWHEPTRMWIMVAAFTNDRIHIYRSPNLKDWFCASEFGPEQGSRRGMWECPDLFALPVDGNVEQMKWVLQVSLNDWQNPTPEHPRMQYFLGTFDGERFVSDHSADTILWSDYGMDHYATVSWSDLPSADGRRVWIGWMSNWEYADKLPTHPWQGLMTLPRTVALKKFDDGIRLLQQPIAELQNLRREHLHWDAQVVDGSGPRNIPIAGNVLEIIATFELSTASEFGLRVCMDGEHFTTIGYEVASAMLFVDRTNSGVTSFGANFPGRHAGRISLQERTLTLHIFIDHVSVEVFGNAGEVVITDLIFPVKESLRAELYARDGTVELRALDIYRLASAWTASTISTPDSAI